MPSASLELTGISKRYPGVQALNRVSFECGPGEVHAVLGENGSGKSTLLTIAGGANVPDDGRVTIMGQPLSSADPQLARRLGLAVVYQDDSLVRELTVAENLILGSIDGPRSMAASARRRWAETLLAPYDLDMTPDMIVGNLSPSQRQFLEIVKALSTNPKVLLLDEPTSSLDLNGVEKLSQIIRRVTAEGTAVVYVSHRLPEILDLADRVTILRDGEGQGTYDISESLSENDLIALMIGRPIGAEYPAAGRRDFDPSVVAIWSFGLSGQRFKDLSFHVHHGEIVGFAGAEGNGQRDALRALGGIEPATGRVYVDGKPARTASPHDALESGIFSLSADRSAESIFPALGVRENMTVQVLESFSAGGIISSQKERSGAGALVGELNIVTPNLDQPISGLSGGNQQKSVLARSFLYDAKAILIDEPTQGVDANARFDIYRAIRAKADEGVACIVNSSDAMELAGLCDRVLVFSRGRVIRTLRGDAITEESIVSSFLRSKEVATNGASSADAVASRDESSLAGLLRVLAGGSNSWWVPLAFLVLLTVVVGGYAALRTDVFLTPLNIRHILLATAPLALVTMAQFNVLMVRGFDISVGSLMSLTVVVASFVIGLEAGTPAVVFGVVVCLAVGTAVGLANGVLVRYVGINPVITTIAMLSVLQGIALYLRATPGGVINDAFLELMRTRIGFAPVSFWLILALAVAGDVWLYRTRSGLALRAVGFREEAAKRNGVRVNFVQLRAYLLSGLLAVLAGFFLASEVGVGHPTIGSGFTLTSIAAAVLGGASLAGGRGSFAAAVFGALFFTLVVNVITLLGLTTGAGIIVSGALTLFAVFLYSGWQPLGHFLRWLRTALQRPASAGHVS